MFNGFTLDLKLLLEDISSLSLIFLFPLYDFAVFFNYFRRIFKNIFNHAEQISQVILNLHSLLLSLGFF